MTVEQGARAVTRSCRSYPTRKKAPSPKPETLNRNSNPKPETLPRNPKPETRNPKLETQSCRSYPAEPLSFPMSVHLLQPLPTREGRQMGLWESSSAGRAGPCASSQLSPCLMSLPQPPCYPPPTSQPLSASLAPPQALGVVVLPL